MVVSEGAALGTCGGAPASPPRLPQLRPLHRDFAPPPSSPPCQAAGKACLKCVPVLLFPQGWGAREVAARIADSSAQVGFGGEPRVLPLPLLLLPLPPRVRKLVLQPHRVWGGVRLEHQRGLPDAGWAGRGLS